MGRCENPECRNITEYGGISRNMAEYHGIWRNITEYGGISRNITIFSLGSHATVYKHRRLTTYPKPLTISPGLIFFRNILLVLYSFDGLI
jgi:hypothetical protein